MNGLYFPSAVRGAPGVLRLHTDDHADRAQRPGSGWPRARDRGVTEFSASRWTAKTILSRPNAVLLQPRPFVKTCALFRPRPPAPSRPRLPRPCFGALSTVKMSSNFSRPGTRVRLRPDR